MCVQIAFSKVFSDSIWVARHFVRVFGCSLATATCLISIKIAMSRTVYFAAKKPATVEVTLLRSIFLCW